MRINNMWYDGKYNLISRNEISEALKSQSALFIKVAVQSGGGHGVTYIKNNGEEFEKRFWETVNNIKVDVVIQKPIKQHEVLSRLNESSVNTVRIISMLSQEGVKIYSAILRMGINGSKVDNASSGGITCGIDRATGRLKNVAYTQHGEKFDRHPTSNVKFETITIPSYGEMEPLIKRMHLFLPHFRLVSWDIAVDEDAKPVLIEANLKYGELDFHQLNNGPLFGDDTQKILKEVTGK